MERMQSTWENQVEINLSESGVHPLTVRELIDEAGADAVLDVALGYPQTNGTMRLRAAIAAMYPGATADHIHVTNGGSEANFVSIWSLLEPGDEVVMMAPNYMQTWGLGARVRRHGSRNGRCARRPAAGARTSTRSRRCSRGRTKLLLLICNPDNPTGARFDASRSRCHLPGRGKARHVGAVGRDLPRGGTGRLRDADDLGAIRARVRHERPVEGVRPSRDCASAGWSASPRSSPPPGRTTTTPASRRARSTTGWRPSRSSPARRARILERTRRHPAHQPARGSPAGWTPAPTCSPTFRPTPAPSSSPATTGA